jgi:hypothetical protein
MPRTGNLTIRPGTKPGAYTVTLDGQDISHLVTAATVTFDPRSLPRAELDVRAVETEVNGTAVLHLKPGTAELLERFGWTPPDAAHSTAAEDTSDLMAGRAWERDPIGDVVRKHGLSAVVLMSREDRAALRDSLASADRSEDA